MSLSKFTLTAATSFVLSVTGIPQIEWTSSGVPYLEIGVSAAEAAPRHAARRTARRTSRRTTRRYVALPRGCPLVGAYYYCGGVYYQRVTDGGQTAYIIVVP